jgi:hypothetical protein
VGLLSGPDDVFAARRGRSRRQRPASRLLVPLLGLLVGALFALALLHLFGAALPAWAWLRPAIVAVAALGCAAFLHWLDRPSRPE